MCHKALVTSLLFFALTTVGCGGGGSTTDHPPTGDNSDSESSSSSSSNMYGGGGSGDDQLDLGQVTLTASGAVSGAFSGMMDFHYMEFDNVGVSGARWELSGHDGSGGTQSFSLTLSIESFTDDGDSIARPGVGTYQIGFEPNSNDVFYAIFTYIGEGGFMNSTEYFSDGENHTGTLTITESSANVVRGTFVANLFWEDYCTAEGCVGDSINISGEFSANERIF